MLSRLGRGGQGAVFLAKDRDDHDSLVAVKLVCRIGTPAAIETRVRQFEHEARATQLLGNRRAPECKLGGATFPRLFGVEHKDPPYLALEYVPWPRLDKLLKEKGGRLEAALTARIGAQVAHALERLRLANVVHNDLKPQNIMADPSEGRACVIDFGTWTWGQGGARPEYLSPMPAVNLYSSPEHCSPGAPVTCKSDVHALGSVLWMCVVGQTPYGVSDEPYVEMVATRLRALRNPPVRPAGMPAALYDVLARTMELDPAKRPDAGALARELDDLAKRLPHAAWLSGAKQRARQCRVEAEQLAQEIEARLDDLDHDLARGGAGSDPHRVDTELRRLEDTVRRASAAIRGADTGVAVAPPVVELPTEIHDKEADALASEEGWLRGTGSAWFGASVLAIAAVGLFAYPFLDDDGCGGATGLAKDAVVAGPDTRRMADAGRPRRDTSDSPADARTDTREHIDVHAPRAPDVVAETPPVEDAKKTPPRPPTRGDADKAYRKLYDAWHVLRAKPDDAAKRVTELLDRYSPVLPAGRKASLQLALARAKRKVEPGAIVSPDGTRLVLVEGDHVRLGLTKEEAQKVAALCAGTPNAGDCVETATSFEPTERELTLPSYFLDSTEVPIASYERCVKERECTARDEECLATAASGGAGDKPSEWPATAPATCLTYSQARTYCEYVGKRLPTFDELEYAARRTADGSSKLRIGIEGRDGKLVPALLKAVDAMAPMAVNEGTESGGFVHIIDNAFEWTTTGSETEGFLIPFGSFESPNVAYLTPGSRWTAATNKPSYVWHSLGFRCALSAPDRE